jgi:hypothetical protein
MSDGISDCGNWTGQRNDESPAAPPAPSLSVEGRQEFEAWMKQNYPNTSLDWFTRRNRYYYGHGQAMWELWQYRDRALTPLREQAKELAEALQTAVEREIDGKSVSEWKRNALQALASYRDSGKGIE